jgi:arginase
VRVPRAWGEGGEAMAEAAFLPLPYPEAGLVDEDTLEEQRLALAAELPRRPLVLGGCCCAHTGAIEGLAARVDRLAVVWLDAHGDLNTPETSPSGNAWGMPLRMAIDSGAVRPQDVALVGARALDPPEEAYIAERGVRTGEAGVAEALAAADAVYVALDCDVLAAGEVAAFMPEPGGPTVAEVERVLREVAAHAPLAGAGLTGLRPDARTVPQLARLVAALGL